MTAKSDPCETLVMHSSKAGNDYCPYCGQLFRIHSSTDVNYVLPPAPGDVACCAKCGSVSIFTDDLDLRRATAAEIEEIMHEVELARAVAVMQKSIESMPNGSTQDRITASMDMMNRINNDRT